MTWQVEGDAGHLPQVFLGVEEMVEGRLDFVFWGSVFVCVVDLDNFHALLYADLRAWLAVGPKGFVGYSRKLRDGRRERASLVTE